MAEVKWIKIVTDIFDDEKILLIETLPEADSIIVIWFKLLCLAGKTNNSGVFIFNDMPYTDSMLSTVFRRKESTVKLALNTFERFGMIEIINNTITIPNWGKHQNLDQLEAKKEYMREYMSAYRDKQKAITNGKFNSKTNSKTNVSSPDKIRVEEELDKDIDKDTNRGSGGKDFDAFWSAYPRKVGKEAARKSFSKIPKSEIPNLIPAVENQKQSEQWKKENGRYIPNPATWLNQGRWQDEVFIPENKGWKTSNPFLELLQEEVQKHG